MGYSKPMQVEQALKMSDLKKKIQEIKLANKASAKLLIKKELKTVRASIDCIKEEEEAIQKKIEKAEGDAGGAKKKDRTAGVEVMPGQVALDVRMNIEPLRVLAEAFEMFEKALKHLEEHC